jgi:hypothetical protein
MIHAVSNVSTARLLPHAILRRSILETPVETLPETLIHYGLETLLETALETLIHC